MAGISRRTFLGLAAGLAVAGCAWPDGPQLDVTRRSVPLPRLPQAFHGFTICHLSDLHLSEFGKDQSELVALIRKARPDLIAMTGDMVCRHEDDERPFMALCDRLPSIAPTYFVTGNHDVVPRHEGVGERAAERGVQFLDNRHVAVERGGERLYLAGAGEWTRHGLEGVTMAMADIPEQAFTVLMAHHPAYIDLYAGAGAGLVLAGHTHGGQVRVPFLGSLAGPDQGFLPSYSAGLYAVGSAALYISRGMGESFLPLRVNCPREVAFLTLETVRS